MNEMPSGRRGFTASWGAVPKWAVRGSGDAIAVAEVARGVILSAIVDVQGTGEGAGVLSRSLTSLALQLAGEGLGAAALAEALSRALWTRRGGRVLADVGILIAEPSGAIEMARYGSVLLASADDGVVQSFLESVAPAGIDRSALPAEASLVSDTGTVVMCSDGVATSAAQLSTLVGTMGGEVDAPHILRLAIERDNGRPKNDMSIVVLSPAEGLELAAGVQTGRLTVPRRGSAPGKAVAGDD